MTTLPLRSDTDHYQCAQCYAIVDAKISTVDHALTCNAQRERMPEKEADKLPCTGGRTNHEWYINVSTHHQFCRQCGLKADVAQPPASTATGGKSVRLSAGDKVSYHYRHGWGGGSEAGAAAIVHYTHRKSAMIKTEQPELKQVRLTSPAPRTSTTDIDGKLQREYERLNS